MTKLKALSDFPFDNKQRHPGEVFDASDADADTLVLGCLAEYVGQPGSYQDRAVKAESGEIPPHPHRKGRYPRRDMRADD